jgi:hypothetical protein
MSFIKMSSMCGWSITWSHFEYDPRMRSLIVAVVVICVHVAHAFIYVCSVFSEIDVCVVYVVGFCLCASGLFENSV